MFKLNKWFILILFTSNAAANCNFISSDFISELSIPKRQSNSTHVFHQYTLKVKSELRSELMDKKSTSITKVSEILSILIS